jgi:hypothetical protein
VLFDGLDTYIEKIGDFFISISLPNKF